MKILDQIRELVTGTTVFREPYEKNGVTVIAALKVSGGGGGGEDASAAGGGGVGLDARPAGGFVHKGGGLSLIPAVAPHPDIPCALWLVRYSRPRRLVFAAGPPRQHLGTFPTAA